MPLLMPILKKNGLLEGVNVTVGIVGSRKIDQNDDYSTRGWEIFAPNLMSLIVMYYFTTEE